MSPIQHIRKIVFGLTQAEFAVLVDVSQGTVSKWESGEHSPGRDAMAVIRAAARKRGLRWNDRWFFEAPKAPKGRREAARAAS